MTKAEIVEKLAKEKTIEKMIRRKENLNTDDLTQDVLYILLDKDENFIRQLYEDNALSYYILAILNNQIFSGTSPYFRTYKEFANMTTTLDEERL